MLFFHNLTKPHFPCVNALSSNNFDFVGTASMLSVSLETLHIYKEAYMEKAKRSPEIVQKRFSLILIILLLLQILSLRFPFYLLLEGLGLFSASIFAPLLNITFAGLHYAKYSLRRLDVVILAISFGMTICEILFASPYV